MAAGRWLPCPRLGPNAFGACFPPSWRRPQHPARRAATARHALRTAPASPSRAASSAAASPAETGSCLGWGWGCGDFPVAVGSFGPLESLAPGGSPAKPATTRQDPQTLRW
eukprot:865565-Alexandrium_andersonii.AAC.1